MHFKPLTQPIERRADIAKLLIDCTDDLVDVSDCGHFIIEVISLDMNFNFIDRS